MTTRSLEDLMLAAGNVADMDVRARLQWVEDAARAAEALELGDDGKDAALHLRAALGAIVKWSQGADTTSKESTAQLEVLVRTLIARGTVGLLRSLADIYDALARERSAPHRAACAEVSEAFRDAARAVERGEVVPASVRERLERARASLD